MPCLIGKTGVVAFGPRHDSLGPFGGLHDLQLMLAAADRRTAVGWLKRRVSQGQKMRRQIQRLIFRCLIQSITN
jgi:hypothetical protein